MNPQVFVPTAPTPRLPPGTYTLEDILLAIKKTVLEEFLRLDMREWGRLVNGVEYDGPSDFAFYPDQIPACGSVACAAGWGGLLMFGRITTGYEFLREFWGNYSRRTLTDSEYDLTYIFNAPQSRCGYPQTEEQAKWLADEIDIYIGDYHDEIVKLTVTLPIPDIKE